MCARLLVWLFAVMAWGIPSWAADPFKHPFITEGTTPRRNPWVVKYNEDKSGTKAVRLRVAEGDHTVPAGKIAIDLWLARFDSVDSGTPRKYVARPWATSEPELLLEGHVDELQVTETNPQGHPTKMKKLPLVFEAEYIDQQNPANNVTVWGLVYKNKPQGNSRNDYRVILRTKPLLATAQMANAKDEPCERRAGKDSPDVKKATDEPCEGVPTDDVLEEGAPNEDPNNFPYEPTSEP